MAVWTAGCWAGRTGNWLVWRLAVSMDVWKAVQKVVSMVGAKVVT